METTYNQTVLASLDSYRTRRVHELNYTVRRIQVGDHQANQPDRRIAMEGLDRPAIHAQLTLAAPGQHQCQTIGDKISHETANSPHTARQAGNAVRVMQHESIAIYPRRSF